MVALKSLIITRSEIERYTGVNLADTSLIYLNDFTEHQPYLPINISSENIADCCKAMEEAAFEEDAEKLNNSFIVLDKLKKSYPDYNWIMVMNI